ncbi:hypothetical protein [Vibrio algivorus]|uniref:Large polyvalent protein-associated domain-containing protein n=1 Tax=Vibrio algivorus TaxID=1667024 RepID=A0ABQ6ELS9_9VIBR|nr:hypothetical protein [Vibrio algivorus]GLT13862.1 hypothetical protein GCM10007931_08360 [Vibrio algivorus]
MAIKFFIAKCERKSSKHPEGNSLSFEFPVKGETQADAKEAAKVLMENQDDNFSKTELTYGDWYKNPQLQRITEEEFNALSIDLEAETNQVELLDNGTYSDETCDTETSQFLYQNNGDKFKGTKVFIRQVSNNEFAYGFKYMCDDFEKHEPMTRNHLEDNRDDAIESGITRLSDFLDFRDEQNVNDEEASFISALLAHDFYREFEEPKDIIAETLDDEKELGSVEQIMDALSEHRQLPDAVQIYSDFLDTVESHMNDIWPNDKSPKLVIEHIQSMQTVDALYQRDVCVASFEQYLPQADLPLTEKTIEAKKNIEKALGITAANDSVYEPIIKAAYYDVSDEVNVVLTTHNYGDQGFAFGFEVNPKNVDRIGCAKEPSDEFFITEKEAIKAAGQIVANELMKFDTSLSLYKKFAHSPYVESFEQNAVILGEENNEIKMAIRKRFDKRPSATTKDAEVEMAYEAIMKHVREDTILEKLMDALDDLQFCNAMYLEPNVKDFVALFTPSMFAEELKSEVTKLQPTVEQKPTTEPKAQKVEKEYSEVKEQEPVPAEVQKAVEKEPANEPILSEVVTIADLPEDYQKNPHLALWMKGFKTDLSYASPDVNGRLSIKTQYRLMKATEIWGPVGIGWGYKVLREWIDTGAPIVMNGEITSHFEQIHKMEIEFWYMHEGQKVSLTQYGDTRKLYLARGGYFVHDDEVEKKSLSDALGKAMSMVGICADVYLGTYDGDLINKTEQVQFANRQVRSLEFDGQVAESALQKAKTYTDKFETAPSLAEIKRLEKLAKAALEAYPARDEDSKRKKEKAIQSIADKAQSALNDFSKDLKQTDKEQANG